MGNQGRAPRPIFLIKEPLARRLGVPLSHFARRSTSTPATHWIENAPGDEKSGANASRRSATHFRECRFSLVRLWTVWEAVAIARQVDVFRPGWPDLAGVKSITDEDGCHPLLCGRLIERDFFVANSRCYHVQLVAGSEGGILPIDHRAISHQQRAGSRCLHDLVKKMSEKPIQRIIAGQVSHR